MTSALTASQEIIEVVTSWPGVVAGPGNRGEVSFRFRGREIGHLHGDHAAHFGFPKEVWAELIEQGRVVRHPIDRPGWAARRIVDEADVPDVIELLRLNYDRLVIRYCLPVEAGS